MREYRTRPDKDARGKRLRDPCCRNRALVLRHSLATFFGSNEIPLSTIQSMLRHTKPTTTARYIHAVNSKQIEAQGKYLEAIKLVKTGTEAA